jgi:NTE family protein
LEPDTSHKTRRIAIACQGGGSHTAFTAGVLKRILKEEKNKFEIIALSGTSGGAICALLAWYGLLTNDKKKSIRLLDSFWQDNSARSYWERIMNEWILWSARMPELISIPAMSPYSYPPWAQEYLKTLLEKQIKFDELGRLINKSSPKLYIGGVNVSSGEFEVFKSDAKDHEISAEAILASAAIPTLFRAVHINNGIYWDGLFSQNPPLKDFVKGNSQNKPDEIWIIQIEPNKREEEPKSIKEIEDRRNELAGNLSLNQEIDFIETVNKWIDKNYLPVKKYKKVKIEKIEMDRDLDMASKLDRNEDFIKEMMDYGEKIAGDFLNHFN